MSILQGECISTDLELMQVIAIEKTVNSLNVVGTNVAYTLLKQEALLLPDAYDTFCERFEEETESTS